LSGDHTAKETEKSEMENENNIRIERRSLLGGTAPQTGGKHLEIKLNVYF
jgi:hypothetical protein